MSRFYLDLNYKSSTRFDMAKFMNFTDGDDPLTSEFFDRMKKIKPSGEYSVFKEEARPDSVSYNIYGDTQYWWILLMYNGLMNPEEIVIGMSIIYPSLEDLENLLFELGAKA